MTTNSNYSGILAQNIETLVYGSSSHKLISLVNINPETYTSQRRQHHNKHPSSSSNLHSSPKTDELAKLHATYSSKINRLQDLSEVSNKNSSPENTNDNSLLTQSQKTGFFKWGDLKRTTVTVSTRGCWLDLNLRVVNDVLLDPYVSNVVVGSTSLLVIAFEAKEIESCKRALCLYNKLASERAPSSVKYQSQQLLLQQGYYHSYNENIVLAMSEMPNIDPLGMCLLIGFVNTKKDGKGNQGKEEGKNIIDQVSKDLKLKGTPDVVLVDESNLEDCVKGVTDVYTWLLNANEKMMAGDEGARPDEKQRKEVINAVSKGYRDKLSGIQQGGCQIF